MAGTKPGGAPADPQPSSISLAIYYLFLFPAYWFGANRFDADGDGDFDPADVQKFLEDNNVLARNFRTQPRKAKAQVKNAAAKGAPEQQIGANALFADRNGDGRVDVADFLESRVQGESVEEHIRTQQRYPVFICLQNTLALLLWLGGSLASSGDFMGNKAGLDSFSPGSSDLRLFGPGCEDWRWQLWRNWSYQFTHVGISHVFVNCFMNFLLGVPLEGLHGFVRIAAMYNAGVLGGALCYWVGDAHNVVVGMSGGCYALIGMHVSDLLMNWHQMKFRVPVVLFLLILIAVDVLSYVLALGESSSASGTAHVGGAVTGLGVGVLFGKNLVIKRCERRLQAVFAVVALALLTFCAVWMALQDPPRNVTEDRGWCWVRQVWNAARFKEDTWVCVKCGSEACVKSLEGEAYIQTVSLSVCPGFLHLS